MIDHAHDLSRFYWFGEMHLEPGSQRSRPLFISCVCRHRRSRYRRHARSCRSNPANQRVAVVTRHRDVGKQNVDIVALENLNRIMRVGGQRNVRAAILERPPYELARIFFVIYHQHSDAVEPSARRHGVRR